MNSSPALRLLSLWLALLLSTSASWADQLGTLSSLRPGQVSFWMNDQIRTYRISPDQYGRLVRQGLGTRCRLWAQEDQLQSFVPSGVDREAQEAIQTLARFAQAIWHKRFPQAFQMVLPESRRTGLGPFRDFWSVHFLSTDPGDWALTSLSEEIIEVSVFSTAIDGWDESFFTEVRHNRLQLRRQNFRWWVESYR